MKNPPANRTNKRRSVRLKSFDYSSPGAYFVTICSYERKNLFGEIIAGETRLSCYGEIVEDEWQRTAIIRPQVYLDASVVMPNHLHGIVVLDVGTAISNIDGTIVGAHSCAPLRRPPRSLGSLVAGFKSVVTKRINELRKTSGAPLWQRNYYEHVIRNEKDLAEIRLYIEGNPGNWMQDQYYISR